MDLSANDPTEPDVTPDLAPSLDSEATPDFTSSPEPEVSEAPAEPGNTPKWLWQAKLRPAFWTIACVVSLTVNIILIVLLIVLARQLFAIKDLVSHQLLGGLYDNFVLMDQARITTTIHVNDQIPVKFTLPVKTNTQVALTNATRINGVIINLRTGGLSITNAPANIVLPAGTRLPIALDITVPVSTTVPVKLTVPVDIPLNQTELHQPFVGLQNVISPYYQWLSAPPNSWHDLSFCRKPLGARLCKWLFGSE